MSEPQTAVTALLQRASRGDAEASRQLLQSLYDELRALARRQLAGHRATPTQQATALVHEAYLRLFGGKQVEWANRKQFFAAAGRVMQQIRIDDARRRNRVKRGGGKAPVSIEDHEPAAFDQDPQELLGVHEALARLEEADARKADVVRLRYFAGLSEEDVAEAMEISRRTVQSEWRIARAWLHRDLMQAEAPRHEGT